ncbi:MAG: hypothetical protein OEY22_00280 [Candidatus Bathyarchaeota archaeon]|nr:hypothetical protein [Candidatus Bathyarchaeota archaeon]MDH5787352.1 hypothetical protein [Candidatus Bathyarchaeota archaeon]
MNTKKAQKIEKTTGYTLLVIGLILMIIPAALLLWMFLSGAQIPQLVPISTEETSEIVKSIIVFSNACIMFFVFIIIVWAGSIISSRGVTMIKDVRLRLIRKSLRESAEAADKAGSED